jgi:hypothetical protein
MSWENDEDTSELPKMWRSMDDLPNIDPKYREWYSIRLAEIVYPETA